MKKRSYRKAPRSFFFCINMTSSFLELRTRVSLHCLSLSLSLVHQATLFLLPLDKSPQPISFSPSGFSPFHEILMSRPQEHDYTGSESLNLKETELRLGLPGSESPERGLKLGVSLFGKGLEEKHHVSGFAPPLKGLGLVSGSKRGFSDANIGGSPGGGKWVFSMPEADLGKKGGALFSPRCGNGAKGIAGLEGNGNCNLKQGPAMKEGGVAVPQPSKTVQEEKDHVSADNGVAAPAAKAQVVGWPPIRSFRKNTMATNSTKNGDDPESKTGLGCLYVKVSMDGAPYLRKVDLKIYGNYVELSSALEKMFSCFTIGQCSSGRDGLSVRCLMDLLHGSEYVLTYEDKDSDWMLVGDVPWEMFTDSCKRLRIMKGSEATGLAPRAMEKCKSRN